MSLVSSSVTSVITFYFVGTFTSKSAIFQEMFQQLHLQKLSIFFSILCLQYTFYLLWFYVRLQILIFGQAIHLIIFRKPLLSRGKKETFNSYICSLTYLLELIVLKGNSPISTVHSVIFTKDTCDVIECLVRLQNNFLKETLFPIVHC